MVDERGIAGEKMPVRADEDGLNRSVKDFSLASFSSDAELARSLAGSTYHATLSTLTAEGYPYGSLVSCTADDNGALVMLISELAEHTINVGRDSRVSALITASVKKHVDPLSTPRLTLVGRLRCLKNPMNLRKRYLERHSYAARYVDLGDFHFWVLDIEHCRLVRSFGQMSWITADEYRNVTVDPVT